jgi:hypothetical protein
MTLKFEDLVAKVEQIVTNVNRPYDITRKLKPIKNISFRRKNKLIRYCAKKLNRKLRLKVQSNFFQNDTTNEFLLLISFEPVLLKMILSPYGSFFFELATLLQNTMTLHSSQARKGLKNVHLTIHTLRHILPCD